MNRVHVFSYAAVEASSTIGGGVVNRKAGSLGDTRKAVGDSRSGKLGHATISCGGFSGMGNICSQSGSARSITMWRGTTTCL